MQLTGMALLLTGTGLFYRGTETFPDILAGSCLSQPRTQGFFLVFSLIVPALVSRLVNLEPRAIVSFFAVRLTRRNSSRQPHSKIETNCPGFEVGFMYHTLTRYQNNAASQGWGYMYMWHSSHEHNKSVQY